MRYEAKPRLYSLIIYMVGFIFCYNFSVAQTPQILLSRPTHHEMTVSILSPSSANYVIKYGTIKGSYSYATQEFLGQANMPSRVVLNDLLPNTKYYYILQYKFPNQSQQNTAEFSFHTQRAKGASFNFTIEADEHLYDKKGIKSLYEICLQNQAIEAPDFMFSLGDMFGDDHTPNETTDADMKDLHLDYLPFLSKITHSIPFYFCLGNHEGENGYYLMQNNGANIATYGTNWRKYYFPNPIPNDFYTGNEISEGFNIGLPENYYAFVWGDVHIIVLDVYRHCDINEKPKNWDWTLGRTQYDWFKKTLEQSNSKFKIVMAHHTRGQGRGGINTAKAFEWGGYNGDSGTNYQFDLQRPGWGEPIHQLMVRYGVNLYLQGHDHVYAKESLDGIIYQTLPMASDSTYSLGIIANGDAFTGKVLDGSGHINISVNENCMEINYVRAYLPQDTISGLHKNREIADSYTIGNCTVATESEMASTLDVFPNPTNDYFNLVFPENQTEGILRIYDATSKIIFSEKINSSSNHFKVDISPLPSGMMMITYQTKNNFYSTKLIKKN
ncbi:MAG: metallophosphoesterase [Saprospiraceae bacterium]|nr:metallophosphoesterase [Saprospiraceae bacterium]